MHAPYRENACAYPILLNIRDPPHSVVYEEPCRHPEVFKSLVGRLNENGELKVELVDR